MAYLITSTSRTRPDIAKTVRRHHPDRTGHSSIRVSVCPVSGCDAQKLRRIGERQAFVVHTNWSEQVSAARAGSESSAVEHQATRRSSISAARECQAARQYLACQHSIGNAAAPPITTAPFAIGNVGLNMGRAQDCAQIAANDAVAADSPSATAPDLYAPGRDNPLTRCFSISSARTRGCAPARDRQRRPAAVRRTRVAGVDLRKRLFREPGGKPRASGWLLIRLSCLVQNHRHYAIFWTRKPRACRWCRAAPKRYVAVLPRSRILASTNGAH